MTILGKIDLMMRMIGEAWCRWVLSLWEWGCQVGVFSNWGVDTVITRI